MESDVGFRGGLVHQDDGFDKGLRLNGAEFGKLCGGGDKGGVGSGVAEEKGNLLAGEGGVDRDGGGADEQDGKVGDGPLGTVFAEDGDAVAVGDALEAERLDYAHDPLVEAGGRDCMPRGVTLVEHDSGLVAIHDLKENVCQSAWLGLSVHAPSLRPTSCLGFQPL